MREQVRRIFAALLAEWCREHGLKGQVNESDTETDTETKTA